MKLRSPAARASAAWVGASAFWLFGCSASNPAPEWELGRAGSSQLAQPQAPVSLAAFPGTNPARGAAALAQNDACESCHVEIAMEWRGSLHQRAYVEPSYQRALAREPLPWCRTCHAPEADVRSEAEPALAELGVGCVSCHVVGEHILAGSDAGQARAPSPHPVLRTLDSTPAGACASCHEFPFPDSALREQPLLMQSTVSEHAASPFAETRCADCHMPRAPAGHKSHRFSSSRDPEALRRSLEASVERAGPLTVRVELSARDVGHAFPTGDLFRRLEVGVELIGTDYQVLARETQFLARHFRTATHAGVSRRELERDDRLPASGSSRVVELELHPARALSGEERIAWWVGYQRVAFPRPADASAEIEGDIVLQSGVLVGSAEAWQSKETKP